MKATTIVILLLIFCTSRGQGQQCEDDTRVRTSHPAVGRMVLPNPCTVWILPNGKLATAGHCFEGATYSGFVEFNIPDYPNPANDSDQYQIIPLSVEREIIGEDEIDWAVFEVAPNAITGLYPIQAQGTFIPITNTMPIVNTPLLVIGCGDDTGVDHRTQQTPDEGPFVGTSGYQLRFDVFAVPVTSGSPVIIEATGVAIGMLHSEDCTLYHYNMGTAFTYEPLWIQATIPGVLADQKDENSERVGTMSFWTGSKFDPPFAPPRMFYLTETNSITLRGDQDVINSKKYNRWNELADTRNHQTFQIEESFVEVVSNFNTITSVIAMKTDLLDAPVTTGGSVKFMIHGTLIFKIPVSMITGGTVE